MPSYMDFKYRRMDSEIRINKYTGSAKFVNIPAQIDGLPVTSIGGWAFWDFSAMKSITIPEGVTSIEQRAFEGCSSLESITIPDSVTIDGGAFIGCSSLESIICSSKKYFLSTPFVYEQINFNDVRINSFVGKYSIITIPSIVDSFNVVSIGWRAFDRCTSLTSITIPESVTYIGWGAFSGCSSLESITIPDSVTSIAEDAFDGCRSLKIYLHKSFKNIAGVDNTIKSFHDKYNDKIHYYDLPSKIFNRIHSYKNKPNISVELLNFVNQLELSLTKDYAPALNDSIIKIFDDIEAAYRRQQDIDNNPVINLTILLEEVSDRKIENAPKYIEKFDDEVAKIEARIKDDIAALEEKKKAILKQPAPSEDFKYTLSQSQGVQIDKYIGNETSVVIPEQIENLPVTVIGYRAFDNPDLRKVVIPESVKSIVYCAFVSQQPMHVLFKGYSIKMVSQSFLAPQITFYCARSGIVLNLRGIINNNPKCNISYRAADFDKA